MANDPTSQFPDTYSGPKFRTLEDLLNHAYIDLEDNFIWEQKDDRILCHACAPGGYKLNTGASPYNHAHQRSPNTHANNVIWLVMQWLKAHKFAIPEWPDAYKPSRYGQLWCLVCRNILAGPHDRENGERHDKLHREWERTTMRPNRLRPVRTGKRFQPRERKRHVLDEILASRKSDYDGVVIDQNTEKRDEDFMGLYRKSASDEAAFRSSSPDFTMVLTDIGTTISVANSRLDEFTMRRDPETGEQTEIHEDGKRYRVACVEYGLCYSDPPLPHIKRCCIGQGCGCTCHIKNNE